MPECLNVYLLDIGRSVYHFLQYIYIPTRYTLLQHWLFIDAQVSALHVSDRKGPSSGASFYMLYVQTMVCRKNRTIWYVPLVQRFSYEQWADTTHHAPECSNRSHTMTIFLPSLIQYRYHFLLSDSKIMPTWPRSSQLSCCRFNSSWMWHSITFDNDFA